MWKLPSEKQVDFLRTLLEGNVKSIVEFDNDVRVQCDVTPARVVFTVFVHHKDMGLVLGDGGATADAIRRIVWTACKKTDFKADMDFMTNGRR